MTLSTQPASPNETTIPLREWSLAALLGLVVSLTIIAPFFWLGNASGHDFEFHLVSWLDVANQWKQHIAYPRWHEWANHGFGEPRFIFYPPLSWMLGAALSFVAPWNAVPAVFICLTQTMACLCAFAFARRWLPWRGAVAAGILYAANPYALLVIYLRSDFAEQLASAFLPLLFLLAFDLADFSDEERSASARSIVAFALVFAAIWLSNAPAGVLASYSMALLIAWLAIGQRKWRAAVRGAGGLALGLGLAGFYLVPAAYEQSWVNIGQVLSKGLQPSENFLYTSINDPEHTLFNWIASTIAVTLIVVSGTAAICAIRGSRSDGDSKLQRRFQALLLIAFAATLLMLRMTSAIWMILPKLRFVQFPWRWAVILAVPFALFAGGASMRRLGALWILGGLAISAGTGVYLVRHAWWDAADVPTLEAALAQGRGFEGTDEYDPAGDDHYDLPENAPHVRILGATEGSRPPSAGVTIEKWSAEERMLRARSHEPLRLALRLLDYPAWRVEVNRSAAVAEHPEQTAQMIVAVPAGNSEVRVRFIRTADRTIGAALSVLACLTALFIGVRKKPTPGLR